jgi:hypothetical protein
LCCSSTAATICRRRPDEWAERHLAEIERAPLSIKDPRSDTRS